MSIHEKRVLFFLFGLSVIAVITTLFSLFLLNEVTITVYNIVKLRSTMPDLTIYNSFVYTLFRSLFCYMFEFDISIFIQSNQLGLNFCDEMLIECFIKFKRYCLLFRVAFSLTLLSLFYFLFFGICFLSSR